MSDQMHNTVFKKINQINWEENNPQKKFHKWLLLYDHNNITNVKKIEKFIELIDKCLEISPYKINDDKVQASLVKNVYFMKKVLNTTISYLTQKKLLKKYNITY